MIKIRRWCFETNSSSVHAMVLNKNVNFDSNDFYIYCDHTSEGEYKYKGNTLIIKPGSFGWETKLLFSSEDKASYLVTITMILHKFDEFKEKLSSWLSEEKIKFKFKNEPKDLKFKDFLEYTDPNYYRKHKPNITDEEIKENQYYYLLLDNNIIIDHFNDNNAHEELLNWCLESKAHMLNFLFGDSFIWLGNDNSENCPDDKYFDKKKYKVIIKGN